MTVHPAGKPMSISTQSGLSRPPSTLAAQYADVEPDAFASVAVAVGHMAPERV
jgi:hypothetical protein